MSALLSIAAAIFSGVLNGSYAAPMKLTGKWEWENIWLMFSIPALIIYPWLFALSATPDLMAVFEHAEGTATLSSFLFGAGWGLGSVAFGLGLYMVGLSLGYTIMMGIIAVTGSIVPMLVHDSGSLVTPGGLVIIGAMAVAVAGVVLCGSAGMIRERGADDRASAGSSRSRFKLGLVVCIIAGIFSSMLNLAFDFGAGIAETAKTMSGGEISSFRANTAIWCMTLTGGFIPNLVYCSYLLIRRGSWRKFAEAGTAHYWPIALVMGLLFIGSLMLYGSAASGLGALGTTVGWLIFMSAAIVTGNFWGILTGEWKNAPGNARRKMLVGSLLLIATVLLVSIGNYLAS